MATSQTGGFDPHEHSYIGKIIQMDKLRVLTLPNGVEIEFGQIIALAGDFYGSPKQPIIDPSKGQNEDSGRQQRFRNAYDKLASAPKEELIKLLATLEKESKNGKTIDAKTWDKITGGKWLGPLPMEKGRMLQLAENNHDHFLPYAKDAYLTGHQLAIDTARKAGSYRSSDEDEHKRLLHEAFSLEAFACHFLTDSFASGHIRTPRVELGNGTIGNLLCKYMHDEDNKYGLHVTNKSRHQWIAYGDGRLLHEESRNNLKILAHAVQKSVDQVYYVYKNHEKTFHLKQKHAVVTNLIPFVDQDETNNSPLFQVKDGELHRRSDISDLQDEKTVTNWWGLTTVFMLWNYKPGNSAI